MKKSIAMILVIMTIACLCCACSSAPSNVEEQVIPESVMDENPLYVCVGNEITVGGITYSASALALSAYDNFYTADTGAFYVNRINKQIIILYKQGTGKYATSSAWDTGLIYEGDITVEGVVVPEPTK